MAQESESPRPHGDRLEDDIEPNPAQRQTDAVPDVTAAGYVEEPAAGISSTANGIPPFDEADGEIRKKLYEKGAELVSRID
jgi:hypothetical protein